MFMDMIFVDPSLIFGQSTMVFLFSIMILILSTRFDLLNVENVDLRSIFIIPIGMSVYFFLDGYVNEIESLHLIVAVTVTFSEFSRKRDLDGDIFAVIGFSSWIVCITTMILYSILFEWIIFSVINLVVLYAFQPQKSFREAHNYILILSLIVGIQITRFSLSGGILPENEVSPHEYHLIMIRYLSAPLIGIALFESLKYWLNHESEADSDDTA